MRRLEDVAATIAAAPGGPVVLTALERDDAAWLVGGAVRDALLGRVARELDVVVDGSPEAVLEALGGTVVERHPRFGTATVALADGARVDVVRARAESYAAPGALPDVRPAGLDADLARRDVTVNAIAWRADAGVRTVADALDDLEAGVLRVLHDGSFVDDPTRLWRVARYAARLGFAVEPTTARLAAAATVATVSPGRIGSELRLALREPDPVAALDSAERLNAQLLPTGFAADRARAAAALELLDGEGRGDLVILAACVGGVDAATLVAWLTALGFGPAERDIVAAGSRASTLAPLRVAHDDVAIARAARGVAPEIVALAGGAGARRWLRDLRHVALEIDGRDLLAAGVPEGPEVGRRLDAALERKLAGHVEGRDAELAAALAADAGG